MESKVRHYSLFLVLVFASIRDSDMKSTIRTHIFTVRERQLNKMREKIHVATDACDVHEKMSKYLNIITSGK